MFPLRGAVLVLGELLACLHAGQVARQNRTRVRAFLGISCDQHQDLDNKKAHCIELDEETRSFKIGSQRTIPA